MEYNDDYHIRLKALEKAIDLIKYNNKAPLGGFDRPVNIEQVLAMSILIEKYLRNG